MTAPVPPTAPRSRIGAHVLSGFAGLVLTPLGIALLAIGAHGLMVSPDAGRDAELGSIAAVVSGALLLGIVAAASGGSSLGPLIGGIGYLLVPGVAFLVAPERATEATRSLLEPLATLTGDGLFLGATLLGEIGALALLGVTLVLVGAAAHGARREGRKAERAEEAIVVAAETPHPDESSGSLGMPASGDPAEPLSSYPSAPTPPRSRVVPHFVGVAIGLVVTPVALAFAASAVAAISSLRPDGLVLWPNPLWGPGTVAVVLLAVVVLSARWSSLGLILGATVWGVLPGATGLVAPAALERGVGAVLRWVGEHVSVSGGENLVVFATVGALLAWGVTAALGGVGAHVARRDGQRRELQEIAVIRARERYAD